MENTTTIRPNVTVTYSLDYYYALFVNPVLVVRFYQIAYPVTFLLGFIGNTASLITFSRITLRKVSTGCLFMALAISDTLVLLMCIFDFLEIGLQISFYRHVNYDDLCRFRSFVMYVAQVLSSWILVIISVDRWIRTRFPFKSGSICTPKKAMLVVGMLLVIDIALHSHILTSMYGILIPGFAIISCGPSVYNPSYFLFYFLNWSVVQILVICLIPVILMILILIDIYINIQSRKRAVVQPTHAQRETNKTQHQKHLQRQMFVLMTSSISIFLVTTLPVAIYRITSPRQQNISTTILQIITIWVGLQWFQSLNYAVNFFTHCLTSTLFRKEFKLQVRYMCGDKRARPNAIELTATALGTRTQAH